MAAAALAKLVQKERDEAVAPEFADVFWTSSRKVSASMAQRAFEAAVNLRNRVFHPTSGALLPSAAEARRLLEELAPLLRDITLAHRFLRRYPILVCRPIRRTQGGSHAFQVLRLIGQEIETLTVRGDRSLSAPPDGIALLAGDRGDALLLSPWVVVGAAAGRTEWTTRFLCGSAKRRLLYADSATRDASPTDTLRDEGDWIPPRELVNRPPGHAREDDVFTDETLRMLREPTDGQPTQLGEFIVQVRLGQGASGAVYLAQGPDRLRALKVLHASVVGNVQQRARLRREYRLMSRISHPGIVDVLGFDEDPEHGPYVVMEFIRGEDLAAVAERGPLPPDRVGEIGEGILSALAAAHGQGVIHRDIKPSNVLLDEQGHPRLIDFGVALAAELTRATRTVEAVGTLAYAAPEQIAGEAVDERSDIYAVGMTLRRLALGFPGPTDPAQLPSGLCAVLRMATNRTPDHRFADALEMREALRERREARWGGAPIQAGDRLNSSFELGVLLQRHDDVWVFSGLEIESEESVTIVLAAGNEAAARLRERVHALSAHTRVTAGHRGLQRTEDGLLFTVLDGDTPQKRADVLLGVNSARAPVATLRSGPPYLQALGPPLELDTSILLLAQRAEILLRLLTIQLLVDSDGERLSDAISPKRATLSSRVRDFESALSEAGPVAIRGLYALLPGLKRLVALRHRAAHATRPATQRASGESVALIASLHAEVDAHAQQLPTERLRPWLIPLSDDDWGLLEVQGSTLGYRSLRRSQFQPPPDHMIDELVRLDLRGMASSQVLREARNRRVMEFEHQAARELEAQPWVARLDRRLRVRFIGRSIVPDMVARDAQGRVLAVADAKARRTARHMDLYQMLTYALALKARLIGLRLTAGWSWYRTDSSKGLVELPGGIAAAADFLSTTAPRGPEHPPGETV